MAACQTLEREPNPPCRAMPFERFQRVCRAGGMEAAMHPHHRAYAVAISLHNERQHFTHDHFARQSSTSASKTVLAVNRIRMSRLPSRICRPRNNSLNPRFTRLRSTARGKTRLGTMRPNLGTPSAFALNKTLNPGCLKDRPPASKAAMSAVRSRCFRVKRLRSLKRSNAHALWRAALESQPVLRAFACEQETRGCASGEPQKVERCVSLEIDLRPTEPSIRRYIS